MKKKWISSLLLLLTAIIWGVAFVAQRVGGDSVGPFTFNGVRSLIGGAVLLPIIYTMGKKGGDDQAKDHPENKKTLWIGGILCGILLCVASNLQQLGILHTSVGKAGFITALYIVIVPIMGIFVKKRPGFKVWIGVALSVVGLYLLCMTDSFSLGKGDLLVLLCALGFSFHIITVDHFSPLVSGVKMSCIQFWVCGILSLIPAFLFENPQISDMKSVWIPLLYAGALSCGAGYTLQIIGQKNLDPTVASLIMSLESVVSVLAGWLLLGQVLSTREIIGCILMFCAIILAQLPNWHGQKVQK